MTADEISAALDTAVWNVREPVKRAAADGLISAAGKRGRSTLWTVAPSNPSDAEPIAA